MRALIRDTDIYFDVDGASLVPAGSKMQERCTAFLVHGGPGMDHTGFKACCGTLTSKMQLVYFDQRGQGRSARDDESKCILTENVEDLEALRIYLGLGPIVSIGTSYGGMVAMAHAARYPDSVSHLILVSTAAHSGFISKAKEIVAKRGTPGQVEQYDALLAGHLDTEDKVRYYLDVLGPLYSKTYDAERAKVARGRAILAIKPLNLAFGPNGYLRTFDLRPQLRSIKAPTLILAGRHDWICAPEFSEEMGQLIQGSDLRVFEESAHSIHADEVELFLDVIKGFLVYKRRMLR